LRCLHSTKDFLKMALITEKNENGFSTFIHRSITYPRRFGIIKDDSLVYFRAGGVAFRKACRYYEIDLVGIDLIKL
jgi:hypothetical protein